MDEYFCTHCGDILNNQYGFNPSSGAWTCTTCGQLLMDDDVYEGDTFEGVAWYCDSCGDLLNKQFGFTDGNSTWTCTACNYMNGITEDDIISNSANNLQCPNCYSTLNDQWLFDRNSYNWTCTSCSAYLHHNFSEDNYSVVEEDDEGVYCERKEVELCISPRRNSSSKIHSSSSVNIDERLKLPNEKLRQKRIIAFLISGKKVLIGYGYNELIRRNIAEVYVALHNKAFNNIKTIPINDIYTCSPYQVGEVEQIAVGGNLFFEASNKFKYDTEIIITYHNKREIKMPFSANSLHKLNCFEVSHRLQELGFTAVTIHPIKDLITGWLIKDGSIERVLIAGDNDFKLNFTYPYDAKIVIEYHTFKSRK